MKLFSTCALCATLTVPALVQTAYAEDSSEGLSYSEEFITLNIKHMELFAAVCEDIIDDKMSPEQGADDINELAESMETLLSTLADAGEADIAELEELMEDEELQEVMEGIDAAIIDCLTALKLINYGDCAELKQACESFAATCDIEF